jgi:hypothetical protein
MKWLMKKKPYYAPKLKVHGSIEDITTAFGNEQFTDTIFESDGTTVRGSGIGSEDGIVTPEE